MADTQQEQSADWTPGKPFGSGPFMEGVEHSPKQAWIAVLLMIVGFAMVGVAVVLLNINRDSAYVVGGVGALIGLVGIVLAATGRIMQNTD